MSKCIQNSGSVYGSLFKNYSCVNYNVLTDVSSNTSLYHISSALMPLTPLLNLLPVIHNSYDRQKLIFALNYSWFSPFTTMYELLLLLHSFFTRPTEESELHSWRLEPK